MKRAGQSGAAMLAHTWTIRLLPGMVADGKTARVFTSPESFSACVRVFRAHGLIVSFSSPFIAQVSRPEGWAPVFSGVVA